MLFLDDLATPDDGDCCCCGCWVVVVGVGVELDGVRGDGVVIIVFVCVYRSS